MSLTAIAGVTMAGFVVACGSSSDDAPPAGDDGGMALGDARFATDSSEPPDDESDAQFMTHADAGCPLKFQGPKAGTIAESIPRTGSPGVAWTNPGGGRNVDGMYASASLDIGQGSEHLRVTGYGFNIPPTVTVHGVVVELKRKGNNQIVDGNIELWLGGMPSDRPKFVASGWPTNLGTHHYGQEVDTWGNDLPPDLVNRNDFGTELYALRRQDAGTGPVSADVESLLITIWYCE